MTNTQPPEEQMLTDEEIIEQRRSLRIHPIDESWELVIDYARAIEAALLAKAAAQQREPVAWVWREDDGSVHAGSNTTAM